MGTTNSSINNPKSLEKYFLWISAGVSALIGALVLLLINFLKLNPTDHTDVVLLSLLSSFSAGAFFLAVTIILVEIFREKIKMHMTSIQSESDEIRFVNKFKPVEEKLINLENTVNRVNPVGICAREIVCRDEDQCPTSLKEIRKLVSDVVELSDPKKEIYIKMINLRLSYFKKNLKNLRTGEWDIYVNRNKVSPTDADLAYDLVENIVLTNPSDKWIKAITLFQYMPWWYSPSGLLYLQKQRFCKSVERIFVFQNSVIEDLFPSIGTSERNSEKSSQIICSKNFSEIEINKNYLIDTLIVLILHWLLNIKVYILSPKMFLNDTSAGYGIAFGEWSKRDIAIFGEERNLSPICAIDVRLQNSIAPSSAFMPSGGSIRFDIPEYVNNFSILKDASFDFDFVIQDTRVHSLVENLSKILCYENTTARTIQNSGMVSLTAETLRKKLDDYITSLK